MPQQQQAEPLDVVQHPTLGQLKFPRSMPFAERNQLIMELESKRGFPPGYQPQRAEEPSALARFSSGAARWVREQIPSSIPSFVQTAAGIVAPNIAGEATAKNTVAEYERARGAGHGIPYSAAAAANVPLGVSAQRMEKYAEADNTAGILGEAAVPSMLALTGLEGARNVIGKVVRKVVPGMEAVTPKESVSLLKKAVKPPLSRANFTKAVSEGMTPLNEHIAATGKAPKSAPELLDMVQTVKTNVWKKYSANIGTASKAGATVDMARVGQAMKEAITDTMRKDQPALVREVEQMADRYAGEGSIPVERAEQFRRDASPALDSYFARFPRGQAQLKGDPYVAAQLAKSEALSEAIGQVIDSQPGPRGAELRKQYGGLSELQDKLIKRMEADGRSTPGQLAMASDAYSAFRLTKGILSGNVAEVAGAIIHKGSRNFVAQRFSTDGLIARAFADAAKKQGTTGGAAPPASVLILLQALGQAESGGTSIAERVKHYGIPMAGNKKK